VVQLSMSPVKDVRRFLDTQGIEADLILVTRPDAGASGMMPVDAAVWEETVREFHRGFSAVQEERGAQRFHLFMSAPTVLAFAMGCTVSTQYDFHLYQWVPESGRYVEVIRGVTRDRLMRAP